MSDNKTKLKDTLSSIKEGMTPRELKIMEYFQSKIGLFDDYNKVYSIPLREMYAICRIPELSKEELKMILQDIARKTTVDVTYDTCREIFPYYHKFFLTSDELRYTYSEDVFSVIREEIQEKYLND